jgi:hypothetical protein
VTADTTSPDPLRQILGYEGAVDPRAAGDGSDDPVDDGPDAVLRTLADDILVMPFWTPSFCATVIAAAEATGAFAPAPEDPVPGHEVSLAVISPRLFEAVQDDLGRRLWPRLRRHWRYIDYFGVRDAFVIRYALGEQEHLRIHHDVAQVSASIKLNDGYQGAQLSFPRQGVDNSSLRVGEVIAWPSLVTHPHQTEQLVSGVKYALTIWFEVPNFG